MLKQSLYFLSFIKSDLFKTGIYILSLDNSFIKLSSSVWIWLGLNKWTTIFASLIALIERSIPIDSTLSSVFLIPAVSIILKGIPLISYSPSTISLVVPAISVTIAFSLFKSKFKIDDFPVLGWPTNATLIPL